MIIFNSLLTEFNYKNIFERIYNVEIYFLYYPSTEGKYESLIKLSKRLHVYSNAKTNRIRLVDTIH